MTDATAFIQSLHAAFGRGDVKTILDWRGALAFGAAFGIVSTLLRRYRR